MVSLIDMLCEPDFIKTHMFNDCSQELNIEKLALCGHSFGASTCILTARSEPRVKAVCVTDSWLWPVASLIDNGGFDEFTTPIAFNICYKYHTLSEEIGFD